MHNRTLVLIGTGASAIIIAVVFFVMRSREDSHRRAPTPPSETPIVDELLAREREKRVRSVWIDRNADRADLGTRADPELAPALEDAMLGTREQFKQCEAQLRARGVRIDKRHEWVVGLRLVGDGRTARVTEVLAVADLWPADFDVDARECWLAALAAMLVAHDKVLDQVVEVPLVVGPQ